MVKTHFENGKKFSSKLLSLLQKHYLEPKEILFFLIVYILILLLCVTPELNYHSVIVIRDYIWDTIAEFARYVLLKCIFKSYLFRYSKIFYEQGGWLRLMGNEQPTPPFVLL